MAVLDKYRSEVTDKKESAHAAKRASTLIVEFLGDTATVSELAKEVKTKDERTISRQIEMLEHFRDKYEHSAGYISRNMSVLDAALNHGKVKNAPDIIVDRHAIADLLDIAPPEEGRYIPTDEELARFIDGIKSENAFRAVIIQLNTACRPEAALDLTHAQRIQEAGLVNLNPKGRRQTRKFRPTVPETECLKGWLDYWKGEKYVGYKKVKGLEHYFQRLRVRKHVNVPEIVPYSLRNKSTAAMRQAKVAEDQVSTMLGHQRPQFRTTAGYGEWDPDYCSDAKAALDDLMTRLDRLTRRSLFAPRPGRKRQGNVVTFGKS